jgi:hypothetical protein
MCLGTFSRLRRSLATSTLYATVRILAELFFFTGKQFPVKQRKNSTRLDIQSDGVLFLL